MFLDFFILLRDNGFKPITLGNTIYRCEMAGVVAIAQLLYAYPDFGG